MSGTLQLPQFILAHQRKVKQKCDICAANFKIGRAEHVCKRCYRSVCDDCAPFKVKCYMPDYKNVPHRMCRKCHVQSQVLQKYIRHNNLKWGEDCDLVKIWLKQMGLKSVPRKRNSQKRKAKQYVDFMTVWKSLNFSFRQFLGLVIDEAKVAEQQMVQLINMGLSELSANKVVDLQHTLYILLFFLAHCSINNAIYFTTIIVQTVYTQQLTLENIHYFLEEMHCIEIQIYKMEAMIEESFEKITKRCTINVFTAQISIQIMSHLISKRQFEELQKGIAYVFSQRKEFICQNSNKPEDICLDILRNISSINYRKVVKDIDGSRFESPQNRSQKQKNSEDQRSQGKSYKSTNSDHKINHLKKQNQQLKQLVRTQQGQIQKLKAQLNSSNNKSDGGQQYFSSQKNSSNLRASGNSKKGSEEMLFRQSIQYQGYNIVQQKNDESSYSDIIHKKNQQIIKLKHQLKIVKQKLNQIQNDPQSNNVETKQQKKLPVINKSVGKQKDEEIQRLKQQNESLNNINKRLFLKMHQLSNLLMDKEQKNIRQTNKYFEDLPESIPGSLTSQQLKQLKKQCCIF